MSVIGCEISKNTSNGQMVGLRPRCRLPYLLLIYCPPLWVAAVWLCTFV